MGEGDLYDENCRPGMKRFAQAPEDMQKLRNGFDDLIDARMATQCD